MIKKKLCSIVLVALLSLSFLFSLSSASAISFSPNIDARHATESNVDSFDVHPENRWDLSSIGMSASVSDSMLNITDVGDGSSDYYVLLRELRDLDGKIEVLFKVDTDNSDQVQDYVGIYLDSSAVPFTYIVMTVKPIENGYSNTYWSFYDDTGVYRNLVLSGNERLFDNVWYVIRIDYDLLKSEMRWRASFTNGTEVFDKDIEDFGYRLQIFSSIGIEFKMYQYSKSSNKRIETLIDYVEAPFKELDWVQVDTPSDGDYLIDTRFHAYVQDDIDETSRYDLCVPYLDHVSASLSIEQNLIFSINYHQVHVYLRVSSVNPSTGVLTEELSFGIRSYYVSPNNYAGSVVYIGASIKEYYETGYANTDLYDNDEIHVDVSFSLNDDRSEYLLKAYTNLDSSYEENYAFAGDVSQTTSEFVVSIMYKFDFTEGCEATALVSDIDLLYREIFQDLGNFVGDVFDGVGDFVGGGLDIFTTLFRWLGGMLSVAFSIVGEGLGVFISLATDAIETMMGVLETAIDLVTTAIDTMASALEAAIDLVTDAIDALMAELARLLDLAIAAIVGIAQDIIDLIISTAADIAEALVAGLILISGLLVDLFVAVLEAILSALGLQGLADSIAEIFSNLITSFIAILVAIPDMVIFVFDVVTFLGWYLLIALWAYVLIISIGTSDNYLEWLSEIQAKLNSGFPEFSILGFSISIKLYMILLPLTIVEVNAI